MILGETRQTHGHIMCDPIRVKRLEQAWLWGQKADSWLSGQEGWGQLNVTSEEGAYVTLSHRTTRVPSRPSAKPQYGCTCPE